MRLSYQLVLRNFLSVNIFSWKVSVQSWCHSSKRWRSTSFCLAMSHVRSLHSAASSNVFRSSRSCFLCYCTAWASPSTTHTHARCWLVSCFRASAMRAWCGVQLDTSSLAWLHLPVRRYIAVPYTYKTDPELGKLFTHKSYGTLQFLWRHIQQTLNVLNNYHGPQGGVLIVLWSCLYVSLFVCLYVCMSVRR